MSRIFALVSPHLDDVALSCARLAAANPGSQVVTVFSAGPESVYPLSEWDRDSQLLLPGDDVTAVRRAEDVDACALLGAVPHHLGFWDGQYRTPAYGYEGPEDDALVSAIETSLDALLRDLDADSWVMPLGLVHPDHQLTVAACLRVFGSHRTTAELYLYWDLPYRLLWSGGIAAAEDVIRSAGFELEEVELELSADTDLKQRAVECHRSQVLPLGPLVGAAVNGPEAYFRLRKR